MTLNISIRKLIKSYKGLTAPEINGKLRKTFSRASVYRWYTRITRGAISAKSLSVRPITVGKKLIPKNVLPKNRQRRLLNNDCW